MNRTDHISGWHEKYDAGLIRFDPEMLVVRPYGSASDQLEWGTFFYSLAREEYKSAVVSDGGQMSFDIELMARLELGSFGTLTVAANPNSLFEGHLVIYPQVRSERLTAENIRDLVRMSIAAPELTFIHNMKDSAASVLDWAHYQAYPLIFPIENDQSEAVTTDGTVKLLQTSAKFPAAALIVESSNIDSTESVVSHLMTTCLDGIGGARAVRSFNLICRNGRTWFIPRSVDQSKKAARYFGGLEMGGLFCLPNADEFRSYLPESLRFEIENASLRATENGLEPFISAARQLIAQ